MNYEAEKKELSVLWNELYKSGKREKMIKAFNRANEGVERFRTSVPQDNQEFTPDQINELIVEYARQVVEIGNAIAKRTGNVHLAAVYIEQIVDTIVQIYPIGVQEQTVNDRTMIWDSAYGENNAVAWGANDIVSVFDTVVALTKDDRFVQFRAALFATIAAYYKENGEDVPGQVFEIKYGNFNDAKIAFDQYIGSLSLPITDAAKQHEVETNVGRLAVKALRTKHLRTAAKTIFNGKISIGRSLAASVKEGKKLLLMALNFLRWDKEIENRTEHILRKLYIAAYIGVDTGKVKPIFRD